MKNKANLSLICACIFFTAASLFTINATTLDPNDCNLCNGLDQCIIAASGQVGKTDCTETSGDCEISGYACWKEPADPGEEG